MEASMNLPLKKTPLHQWHVRNNANMANFGGYEMPLWYTSVKNEHLNVLTRVGIFDTSHMAAIQVKGPDAFDLIQKCFTNDISACVGRKKRPLSNGRCVYGAILDEKGWVKDDAIIMQIDSGHYFVVVNAGMGAEIVRHFVKHLRDKNVELVDLTDRLGKMDIQGPHAVRVLEKILTQPEKVFDHMPYFSFKGAFDDHNSGPDPVRLVDGTPILLSRTGYTGELGFEIFIQKNHLTTLWETVLKAGKDSEIMPCGLAARDSLRAGAMLPLSHQDIGPWPFINHPWHFALPFHHNGKSFTKSFIGDHALLNGHVPAFTYAYVGFDLRKVSSPEAADVADSSGRSIGKVLTCVTDMGIGRDQGRIFSVASPDKPEGFNPRGLCCGFIKVDRLLSQGEILQIKDSRRAIKIEITDDIRPDRTARMPINRA